MKIDRQRRSSTVEDRRGQDDGRGPSYARGVVVPESFTHGSAKARMAAFSHGFEGKAIDACASGF